MTALYPAVHGAHLLSAAVIIGFMAVVQWSVVPAQQRLDGRAYALFEATMNVPLQRLTPALLLTAILTGAAATALARLLGSPVGWLHLAVVLGLAAMTVSTLIVNAPVNDAINTWDPDDLPADWAALRARWERGHAIRVGIGIPTLLLAVTAAVL